MKENLFFLNDAQIEKSCKYLQAKSVQKNALTLRLRRTQKRVLKRSK